METAERWLALAAVCLAAAILFCAFAAFAHDHEHPSLDSWYESLRSKGKVPCCEGKEATHLADVDWDSKDGHYRVRIEGNWYDVPEDAVIEEPNRDGRPLVWTYTVTQYGADGAERKEYRVRCFMAGAGG